MNLWVLLILSYYSYIILIYLLPYIHIYVYTTIHIYAWRAIYLPDLPAVLVLHSLISIFPFPFLISTSLFIRLLSSSTFILQRYRRQGTRQTPERALLAENFSWPSEIIDCGFLKTFTGQFFALGSLNTCDLTLHIKGSRWRLHRNDKKKFGSKKRKNYKKVENRDAQNK